MPDRVPAIKLLLLPKDTNAYGTIFGGVILSHIDLASAVEARKTVAPHRYVTRAMREVEFHEPVFVGDIVSFYTETVRVGRTSVTVRVWWRRSGGATPPVAAGATGPWRAGEGDRGRGRAGRGGRLGRPVPVRPEPPVRVTSANAAPRLRACTSRNGSPRFSGASRTR
jgi:acyl-coenzyme A thioesterase PaaI-like protein